jgi:hypothetical protein
MALNLAALKSSPGLPGAGNADYPPTLAACVTAWCAAIQAWASAVVPASTTVAAATATLNGALTAAFGTTGAAAAMETAMTAFGATVGGGMAPAFVAVPPPAPVGFATLFSSNSATKQGGVDKVADALHAWALTGTATPSGGGPAVNWS